MKALLLGAGNSTFLGLKHFAFHSPATASIVIQFRKTLLLCEQWEGLPILEWNNFGSDVSVCLSCPSEQPLNLRGSLGIKLGVGAQQEEDGSRKELEIFSPCSCCGSCWLMSSKGRLAGLSGGTGCTELWAVPGSGPHGPGAEELLQPRGHLGTHLCHLSVRQEPTVEHLWHRFELGEGLRGTWWLVKGTGCSWREERWCTRCRGVAFTVLSSARELWHECDTAESLVEPPSHSERFVSVADSCIFGYWSTKSLVSILFWTVCISLCKQHEFSHRGKSWK